MKAKRKVVQGKKGVFPVPGDPGWRGRSDTFNWPKIRAEYVTTDISRDDLARKHGVSASMLNRHAGRELWIDRRREWRAESERKVLEVTQEELLRQRVEAIKIAHGLKLRIAKNLQERLDGDSGYEPSVKDYEVIERLEMDLKGTPLRGGEQGQGTLNVSVRIENVLEKLEETRAQLEVVEVMAPSGPDPEVAEFMYGADDSEDEE